MNSSRFDNQLLPEERILWHGQPDKEAFRRGERRLVNWVMSLNLAWATVFGVDIISNHGFSYAYSHHGIAPIAIILALALLAKIVFVFTPSRAGDHWYAVTNQRIFAETPDEGSQTTIVVPLYDVGKVSLQQKGEAPGTLTIVTKMKTHRERRIFFQDVSDAPEVYSLLTQVTSRPASA